MAQTASTKKKRPTKAEQEAAKKKKRDREVMFWGIAGCVCLIGFGLGWGKFVPYVDPNATNESAVEEVSSVANPMTDFQIDDILDAVDEQCDKINEDTYAISADELRYILEMVLKGDEDV